MNHFPPKCHAIFFLLSRRIFGRHQGISCAVSLSLCIHDHFLNEGRRNWLNALVSLDSGKQVCPFYLGYHSTIFISCCLNRWRKERGFISPLKHIWIFLFIKIMVDWMNETTDKRENQQQWVNSIEVYFYDFFLYCTVLFNLFHCYCIFQAWDLLATASLHVLSIQIQYLTRSKLFFNSIISVVGLKGSHLYTFWLGIWPFSWIF